MARFGGFQRVAQHLRLLWRDTRGSVRQDPAAGDSGRNASAAEPAAASAAPASAAVQQSSGAHRMPWQDAAPVASAQLAADGRQQQAHTAAAAEVQLKASAEQSPALREAAREMAALMDEQQLDHVPGRIELEAAGAHTHRCA